MLHVCHGFDSRRPVSVGSHNFMAFLTQNTDLFEIIGRDKKSVKAYDMGAEWNNLTGLSMTFCVWVANKRWSAENKEVLDNTTATFGFYNESLATTEAGDIFDDAIVEIYLQNATPQEAFQELQDYYEKNVW